MVCTIVFSLFVIPVSAVASSTPTSSTPTSSTPTKPDINISLIPKKNADDKILVLYQYYKGDGDPYVVLVLTSSCTLSYEPTQLYGDCLYISRRPTDLYWLYHLTSTSCTLLGGLSPDGNKPGSAYIVNNCTLDNIVYSEIDILNKDGTIFFPRALPPQTALVAGAGESLTPQTLLTSMIGLIKPLVLLLIGLAGFWMCWHFLLRALRRA